MSFAQAVPPTEHDIKYLVDCLVFAPKLPQQREDDPKRKQLLLLYLWLEGCSLYQPKLAAEPSRCREGLLRLAQSTLQVHLGEQLKANAIVKAIRALQPGDGFAVFLEKQNCGILFHRRKESTVTLEMFEVSAENHSVMSSMTPHQRVFPGVALVISTDILLDEAFAKELARALADLAVQPVPDFVPVAPKAGKELTEIRDTASPKAVTEALASILLVYGHTTDVEGTSKRIRDEVSWNDCLEPWRRPPMWLVIRVAAQRWLEQTMGPQDGRRCYKNLQVLILSKLCSLVTSHESLRDELFFIKAKLGRRLDKLRRADELNCEVDDYACRILENACLAMQAGWQRIQKDNRRLISRCEQPDQKSTFLHFENSRDAIRRKLQPATSKKKSDYSGPGPCPPRVAVIVQCEELQAVNFSSLQGHDLLVALHDFEEQVCQLACQPLESNCMTVEDVFCRYKYASESLYAFNADRASMRLLTLMELWVQLDKMVLQLEPMMRNLSAEIPKDFMRHLRLPSRAHLHRVQQIEAYLQGRTRLSSSQGLPNLSPFHDHDMMKFAGQYFDDSKCGSEMRSLRARIRKDAAAARESKQREWDQKSTECRRLQEEMSCLSHETWQDQFGNSCCYEHCHLCRLRRLVSGLEIRPFEAPLPNNERQAKWMIFELLCPEPLRAWREVTWKVLIDLGGPLPPGSTKQISCRLFSYTGLKQYHHRREGRLCLGSSKKSFHSAHYGGKKKVDSTNIEQIILPHGPEYFLFDSKYNALPQLGHGHEQKLFWRYPGLLPKGGNYVSSKTAIRSVEHTPNEVIAWHKNCPQLMSLFEFHDFSVLRSGESLQWLNILTELASPSLQFTKCETQWLITQAALEIGTAATNDDLLRKSHWVFQDQRFCEKLFSLLERHITDIKLNWKEHIHMRSLLVLVLRLESLASDLTSSQACRSLRSEIRDASRAWTRQLRQDLDAIDKPADLTFLQHTRLSAALLCRATYTVCDRPIVVDWSPYFECGFILANEGPADINKSSGDLSHNVLHDWANACELEKVAIEAATSYPQQLSSAVDFVWKSGQQISCWKCLDEPRSRWLHAWTEPSPSKLALQVHVNALTGELLVEGQSPGKLPKEYLRDRLYRELFGSRQFEILPSPVSKMDFIANAVGCRVHFGWDEDGILIGREFSNGQIDVLLPREIFGPNVAGTTDLPGPLIEDHFHWLSTLYSSDVTLHVCPRDRALGSVRDEDWIVHFHECCATQRESKLLDPNSNLVTKLVTVLGGFETNSNIVASLEPDNKAVLTLPRFGLTFELSSDGRLFCPDLNGIVLDNQDAGTFIGLSNYLLLSDRLAESQFIVVPQGQVGWKWQRGHIAAFISTDSMERVETSKFVLNFQLHRLDCSGEPQDMLLKAYLHAITSSTVPDPFTGRRGTEEAVAILHELLRQTYSPLDADLQDILNQIEGLTPKRSYYPDHLQVMQTSTWDQFLPSSSQTNDFQEIIRQLIDRSNKLNTFSSDAGRTELRSRHEGSDFIQKRHMHRTLQFYPYQQLYSCRSILEEDAYNGRDRLEWTAAAKRTHEVASLIKLWTPGIESTQDFGSDLSHMGALEGFHAEYCRTTTSALFSLTILPVMGRFIETCRCAKEETHKIRFLFLFPFLAFGDQNTLKVLRALLAIAFDENCQRLKPPPWSNYADYQVWQKPYHGRVRDALLKSDTQPNPPPVSQGVNESYSSYRTRVDVNNRRHKKDAEYEADQAAMAILEQWPSLGPQAPRMSLRRINFWAARGAINGYWESLWHNWQLSIYFSNLSAKLRDRTDNMSLPAPLILLPIEGTRPQRNDETFHFSVLREALMVASVRDDASKPQFQGLSAGIDIEKQDMESQEQSKAAPEEELKQLEKILDNTRFDSDRVLREFTSKLKESLSALMVKKCVSRNRLPLSEISRESLAADFETAQHNFVSNLSRLEATTREHPRFKHLNLGGLWPRMDAPDYLQFLCSPSNIELSRHVKKLLIDLARSLIHCQRMQRLLKYHQQGEQVKLSEEIASTVHEWDLNLYPEWLILELEMDVCIRPEQVKMALEMAKPEKGLNSIYQLQMGKGKSSLIIPMLAAVLPTKKDLFKIIVPKPLLHQMGAILKQRLCRLLQRPILHLPFTRSSPKDALSQERFRSLHEGILDAAGTVITLPEHVQSYQLSGLQSMLDNHLSTGRKLMTTSQWLDSISRDVLDECDHILGPRTQLIYPSGSQTQVDGGSGRWNMIAHVLRLIYLKVREYEAENADEIEVEEHRSKGFPFIHIETEAAGAAFVDYIVEQITLPKISRLPLTRLSPEEISVVRKCLKNAPLPLSVMKMIEARFQDKESLNDFFILRGLLWGGILLLALRKRWNVHYGLHLERCQIAVPYLARGRPSAASEYGHPDVALTLTFLAYYHNGLQEEQLRLAIEKLQLEQDPSLEWDDWVRFSNAHPAGLRSWASVNLEDERLVSRLWGSLSHSLPAINFYLDRVVFPRAAREFSRKLVSSSWDLPLTYPRTTTGFSGTNDNSELMPDSISAKSLPLHTHTNAEVLCHLLQPRNRTYIRAADDSGKGLSVGRLLDLVSERGFEVLLDAGALVLEMENAEVGAEWLKRRTDVAAVVYFNEKGKLSIRYRNGRIELLSKSKYASNLAGCLLYLDEEHCRGTDTKLSASAKAVLTIGPHQPKDQTVQAAMRMRQLAYAQSVVFLAPPPVDRSIRDFCGLTAAAQVDSSHVISWSIQQTCTYINSHLSLRDSQRRSYERRRKHIEALQNSPADKQFEAAGRVPEVDKRSLRELYGPHATGSDLEEIQRVDLERKEEGDERNVTRACAEEEQERQVDQEVQEEQQREDPEPEEADRHELHPHVRAFALKGGFRSKTPAYDSGFVFMAQTQAAKALLPNGLERLRQGSRVLVTRDFFRTVKLLPRSTADHAQRPVRFLIWTHLKPEYLLVISPFEAEQLIPDVRTSSHAHILLYGAPRTRSMVEQFGTVRFFGVPKLPPEGAISQQLLLELFVFSGGLFFPWEVGSELRSYMQHLNAALNPSEPKRSESDIGCTVAEIWRKWLQLRHHGIDTSFSPAGYLIEDRALDRTDRLFAS